MLPDGKHKAEALTIIRRVLDFIADQPFDEELEFQLNRRFGPYSGTYEQLAKLLTVGVASRETAGMSVDGSGTDVTVRPESNVAFTAVPSVVVTD